jgi:hypothetical protein
VRDTTICPPLATAQTRAAIWTRDRMHQRISTRCRATSSSSFATERPLSSLMSAKRTFLTMPTRRATAWPMAPDPITTYYFLFFSFHFCLSI